MFRLFMLLTLVFGQDTESEEVCLLTLNAARSTRSSRLGVGLLSVVAAKQQWNARHSELSGWTSRHRELRAALAKNDKNEDLDMEKFITDQKKSEDACHAKIAETRRTLDGLATKIVALSDEYQGSESVIEGNTLIIKEAVGEKEKNDKTKVEDTAACDSGQSTELSSLQRYRDELKELDEIANPAVRSKVALDIDHKKAVSDHVKEAAALVATDKQRCHRFAAFLNRANSTPQFSQIDCHGQRKLLQEEFTKAYTDIAKLLTDGTDMAGDTKEDCEDVAAADHKLRETHLDRVIADATKAIEESRETLEDLTPLLSNAKAESERLTHHLDTMKNSCDVTGDVSEHLVKVRELIHSLEECPGRNDFTLKVPQD